eukprot:GILJ01002236.1.p1 GENE.GILJ01002236.1~~GILJ01002236.1.p1  ORF type:complete len:295 (-),score=-0.07 GILJ01002236.1:130-966(-)
MAEFSDVGAHCSQPYCRQQDFLPFECNACHQMYCLDHRSYSSHECQLSSGFDARLIICPLCSKGIRLIDGENPNLTWQRHSESDCLPGSAPAKRRCPVKGCKTQLTLTSTFKCPECRQDVCMSHRWPADHRCRGKQAVVASSYAKTAQSRLLASSTAGTAPPASTSTSVSARKPAKPAIRASQQDIRNVLRETAHRRQPGSTQRSPTAVVESGSEVCHVCSASFATPVDLIRHYETCHPNVEPCPICQKEFQSTTSLTRHIETAHPESESSSSGCTVS